MVKLMDLDVAQGGRSEEWLTRRDRLFRDTSSYKFYSCSTEVVGIMGHAARFVRLYRWSLA